MNGGGHPERSFGDDWDIWDTYLCWDRTGVVRMVCDNCDTYLAGSLIVHCLCDAGSGDPSGSVAYFLSAGNGWKSHESFHFYC